MRRLIAITPLLLSVPVCRSCRFSMARERQRDERTLFARSLHDRGEAVAERRAAILARGVATRRRDATWRQHMAARGRRGACPREHCPPPPAQPTPPLFFFFRALFSCHLLREYACLLCSVNFSSAFRPCCRCSAPSSFFLRFLRVRVARCAYACARMLRGARGGAMLPAVLRRHRLPTAFRPSRSDTDRELPFFALDAATSVSPPLMLHICPTEND